MNTINLVESFKYFQQCCKFYFFVKGLPEDKQFDHILLLAGEGTPTFCNV